MIAKARPRLRPRFRNFIVYLFKRIHVDADGHRAKAEAIVTRHCQTGLRDVHAAIFFNTVNQHSLRADLVGFLPLGFIALHQVTGAIGLADIEANIIHDKNLGDDAAACGFDTAQPRGQFIAHNR